MNREVRTNLDGVKILDSWFEDLGELKEQCYKLQRYIQRVERARKSQPILLLRNEVTGNVEHINQFHLENKGSDLFIVAESRRPATAEETEWFEEQEAKEEVGDEA